MESTTYEKVNEFRASASEFMNDRKYLKNVTSKTLAWYEQSFKAFAGALGSEAAIKQRIVELRTRGVSATSVNTWLRCINAYLHWQVKPDRKCSAACEHLRLPKLKEEQKVLATLNTEQMKSILTFKPKGRNQIRAHLMALLMLDGGYRISEVLGLGFDYCDFDNLVVKVKGKGNKHRLVPMSGEMRRVLYRYATKHSGTGRLLFGTRLNTVVTIRNFQRDFKIMGEKLGITGVRFSPHTLRHTFAVSYLRAGGNLFYLSKILGHSSVTTTQRYLQSVSVDDLQAVHDRLSPLARR